MFDAKAFIEYLYANKDLPHKSSYHQEGYFQHCLLAFNAMWEMTKDDTLLVAIALHDVAKVRTQGWNKKNEPCFWQHNEITDEELSLFLSPDDPRYSCVKALIWCHMEPYNHNNSLAKYCRKTLKKGGIAVEVDDVFISHIRLINKADDTGTIRTPENMAGIEERCNEALDRLMQLK